MNRLIATFILLFTVLGVKAQDYFPIVPESYWIYDIYHDGEFVAKDSTTFDKTQVINDTTFYLFIHHYLQNGEVSLVDTLFLFDNTIDNNTVMLSNRNVDVVDSAIYAKHDYKDGEYWVYQKNIGPDTIKVEYIDDLTVAAGSFTDCYLQGDEYYFAPDVGIVKIMLWNDESYFELIKYNIPEDILSLERAKVENFEIYPNPVSEYLQLQVHNSSEVKIYSLDGVLHKNGKYTTGGLYVGNLKAGVYILVILENGSLKTKRFIKK